MKLLKVLVQPVWVAADADGNLSEISGPPVPVTACDWPTFATGAFLAMEAEVRARVAPAPVALAAVESLAAGATQA